MVDNRKLILSFGRVGVGMFVDVLDPFSAVEVFNPGVDYIFTAGRWEGAV